MAVEHGNSQSGPETSPKFTRPLRSIALFGGTNEISQAAARFIREQDQDVVLRLLIRKPEARAELGKLFPDAEIVVADYFDRDSLVEGLRGIDAVFVVTPDFFDETTAMTNVVHAAKAADIQHIVRMTGDPPGMTMARVPDFIKRGGNVPSVQHLYARAVLEASGLPVTFLNSAAYYMQTLLMPLFADPVRNDDVLLVSCDKLTAFIDKADIGACVGALLLSDDYRHIGASYHVNNGHDLMRFDKLAEMFGDVLGRKIEYQESEQRFLEYHDKPLKELLKIPDAGKLVAEMFKFEWVHEHAWRRSDMVQHLLGRPAKTLRVWLEENKQKFEPA